MRLIERKLKNAWDNNQLIEISNSAIRKVHLKNYECFDIIGLYLFGNLIATKAITTGVVSWTMAGWNSLTTRSRLNNVLGIGVYQVKHVPWRGDVQVDPSAWYAQGEAVSFPAVFYRS